MRYIEEEGSFDYKKLIKKILIGVAIAFTVIVLISQSIGVVSINNTGIWKRAGVIQNKSVKEGWHFKIPFIDSIENMSNLVQTTTISYDKTKETAETKDQQLIMNYNFEIQHQLEPEMSFVVYKNYGKNYENILILSNAIPIIKQAFALYDSEEYTTHKSEIGEYVKDKLNSITSEYGIKIVQVNFKSYDFTKDYDKILEERARLKAEIINTELNQDKERVAAQTQYDVAIKKAEEKAESNRIEAENQKEVALIKAEQDKQTAIIEANAKAEADKISVDNEAYVITTRAEAEKNARLAAAEATKAELEAQSAGLNDLIIQREWINHWNGQLVPSLGGNGITFTNLTDIIKTYFGN